MYNLVQPQSAPSFFFYPFFPLSPLVLINLVPSKKWNIYSFALCEKELEDNNSTLM